MFTERISCPLARTNWAKYFDTEAPIFDFDGSVTNGIVSSRIYDKRDHFNFEIVIFHFLMGMFLAPLPMIYTETNF